MDRRCDSDTSKISMAFSSLFFNVPRMNNSNFQTNVINNKFLSEVLLNAGLTICKMKVIFVPQIIKIVGLRGKLLFCTARVLQVNWAVRQNFILLYYIFLPCFCLVLLIAVLWDIFRTVGCNYTKIVLD